MFRESEVCQRSALSMFYESVDYTEVDAAVVRQLGRERRGSDNDFDAEFEDKHMQEIDKRFRALDEAGLAELRRSAAEEFYSRKERMRRNGQLMCEDGTPMPKDGASSSSDVNRPSAPANSTSTTILDPLLPDRLEKLAAMPAF